MHIGQNIARIRSFQGIKQSTMAHKLNISQQAYSKIEQSPELDDNFLERIALELGCTSDTLRQLGDTPFMQNFNHNCANVVAYQFNPVEKIVSLYEELLKSEREKISLLESMLKSQESHTKKK